MNRFFSLCCLALLLLINSIQQADAAKKKEVYIPMDYSTCGYHASEQNIPNVKNVVTVAPVSGDSYATLQKAINYVGSLKADKHGFRGAILLRGCI